MTQYNSSSAEMGSDTKTVTKEHAQSAGKMSKTLILTLAAVFALTPFTIDDIQFWWAH